MIWQRKWVKQIAVVQAKLSHILRPGNTAFKEQLKLINGFEKQYQRIHKKKKIKNKKKGRVLSK
jgi:hypothetical protein